MEPGVAGITAALLSLLDLDRTFYVPAKTQRKLALYSWWWGFIVANGILAAGLYGILGEVEALRGMPPLLRAIIIGIAYLAIIRAKFTTFNIQGRDVPFGLEAFYEAGKQFVYKRINRIAKEARYEETTELAKMLSLEELGSRAKLSIEQDSLLSPDDKRTAKAWLLRVLQDSNSSDLDKRLTLADFILSGQRSGDFA